MVFYFYGSPNDNISFFAFVGDPINENILVIGRYSLLWSQCKDTVKVNNTT